MTVNLYIINQTKSVISNFTQVDLKQNQLRKINKLLTLNTGLTYNLQNYIKTSNNAWLESYTSNRASFNNTFGQITDISPLQDSIATIILNLEKKALLKNNLNKKQEALAILESDSYINYKKTFFDQIEETQINNNIATDQLINTNSQTLNTAKKKITFFIYTRYFILIILLTLGYYIYVSFHKIKKLNAEILISENKHRNTILNLLEGFYTATIDGEILSYNHEFENILGLTPHKNYSKLFISDFWGNDEERSKLTHHLKEYGYIKNYVITAKKINGEPLTVMINAQTFQDDTESPLRIEGTLLDITPQKEAEIKLKESQEGYKKLMDSSIQGLIRIKFKETFKIGFSREEKFQFIKDNSYIAECNDILAQFYGFNNANELLNKPLTYIWDDEETMTYMIDLYISNNYEWKNLRTEEATAAGEVKYFLNNLISLYKNETEIEGCWVSTTDITEQVVAEEKIKISEERNNLALTVNNDGYFDWDIPTGKVYFDARYYTMAGYEPNEFSGSFKEWEKRVHRDDFLNVQTKTEDFLAGKTDSYDEEFRFLQKNGEWMWVRSRIKIFEHDESGKAIRLIGTHTDITNQKIAENALKDNEQKFKSLIKHAPDAIYLHDIEGNILDTNIKATRDLNYSIDEIKKLTIFDVDKNIASKDEIYKAWNSISPETSTSFVAQHQRKDGTVFPVEVKLSVFYDKGKKLFLAFVRDISDRKKIEEEKNKLTQAIDQSPICIIITNTDGIIEYVNPFFEKTTGYSIQETIGKSPKILNSGYHSKEYYKEMWSKLLSGESWYGEFRNKKKNGDLYWENVNIAPVKNSENKITHFIALKEDITEKKKILSDLEEAKNKAEEADRLKTAFLASMSHEIRTPLNSIVGFSTIIAEETKSEDFKEFSGIIHDQSEVLLRLIDDLIDFARIESETIEIKPTLFDLNSLLKSLHTIFEHKCCEDVTLIMDPQYSKILISSDKNRLKQIFINLITNALKFTNKGSITFGYYVDNNSNVTCFVKDTGIGIPKNQHDKVFERFTKLNEFAQGTGLGLSIIKKIINLMDGTIELESEANKGATFKFHIPFEIKEVDDSQVDEIPLKIVSKNKSNFTILVAEDNESNFFYIEQILKNEDYNIIRARNGQLAVDICENNKDIDLILMDIKMPVLDGWDACVQIKKTNPLIPVIAQTAHALTDDIEKANKLNFDGYIPKPLDKELLLKLINKFRK